MLSRKRNDHLVITRITYIVITLLVALSCFTVALLYSNTAQTYLTRAVLSRLAERVGLELELAEVSIRTGRIELGAVSFYEPGQVPVLELEHAVLEFDMRALLAGRIDIGLLRLDGLQVRIEAEPDSSELPVRYGIQRLGLMFRRQVTQPQQAEELLPQLPHISVGMLQLQDAYLAYNENQVALELTNIRLGATSFQYKEQVLQVEPGLLSLQMKGNSGTQQIEFSSGTIGLHAHAFRIEGFELDMAASRVRGNALAEFSQLPRQLSSLSILNLELSLHNSRLYPSDIETLLQIPSVAPKEYSLPAEVQRYAPLSLDLDLRGDLGELRLEYAELRSDAGGRLSTRGLFRNLDSLSELNYELEFDAAVLDLPGMLEGTGLAFSEAALPGVVVLGGMLEGSPGGADGGPALRGEFEIETPDGSISVATTIAPHGFTHSQESLPFELELRSEGYRVAGLSPPGHGSDTLIVDAYAHGDLRHLQDTEGQAKLELSGIRGTPGMTGAVELRYRNRELSYVALVDEPALAFVSRGTLQLMNHGATGEGQVEITTVDFTALGLREHDLQLSAAMEFGFAYTQEQEFTALEAELRGHGMRLSSYGTEAQIERFNAVVSINREFSELSVDSDLFDLQYRGTLAPGELQHRVTALLYRHTAFLPAAFSGGRDHEPSGSGSGEAEAWFELHRTELLTEILVPELRSIQPFSAGLVYDAQQNALYLSGWVPALRYAEFGIEDFSLRAVLDPQSFEGAFGLAALSAHSDESGVPFEVNEARLEFLLQQEHLHAAVDSGTVAGEELGRLTLEMDLGSSSAPGPLIFRLEELRVAAIQGFLGNSTETLDGVLEGAGRIDLTAQLFELELELRDSASDLQISASYARGEDLLDGEIVLPRLEMAYLEGFSLGEIEDTRGYISGRASIAGSLSDPRINGSIRFYDVGLLLSRVGARVDIHEQELSLSTRGLEFDNFTILDQSGVPARLNGQILVELEDGNHELDLRLGTRGFRIIDTTAADNPLFYGRVIVDADLRILGAVSALSIDGGLRLRQGSAVTFVMPQQDTGIGGAERVIRFTDEQAEENDHGRSGRPSTGEPDPLAGGVELGVNVEVDNRTQVDIIVDQASGDRLSLRGGGRFSLGVDRSGETSLTGTYTISSGEYRLSFQNIVRREFRIRSGSSVLWSGDPMNAQLNVTAEYNLRTSPASLVGAYLNEQELAAYRRQLPFQVLLELSGRMSEPQIEFLLDMPPAERGALAGTVYNRVQQLNENEADRNRQAFALLVFNQFLGEEFAGFDEGAVVSAGARSSAARLLTQQLNFISSRVAPGLNLAFEIESFQEAGEQGPEGRTELQVHLSRQFFDERIRVELGGQFELEGEQRGNGDVGDFAGDIVVEYLITEDGRYRIRGFRRNEYQGPVDGTLATTGVSLVYTRSFDRLRDLFSRPREDEVIELPVHNLEQGSS